MSGKIKCYSTFKNHAGKLIAYVEVNSGRNKILFFKFIKTFSINTEINPSTKNPIITP